MKKISIIIPVYNNSKTIILLYNEINNKVFTTLNDKYQFELIFVNDGSKDNSYDIIKEITKKDHRVHLINLSRNFGQQYAILAGWENCTGDVSIDFSADLQDPPEQCLKMLDQWENGNKIVVSYRQEQNIPITRKITSKLFYRVVLPSAPKGGFDFTLLDRKPLDVLISFKDRNRFYQADILSLGFSFLSIPYIKGKRFEGKSQYSSFKRYKLFLQSFLNVSYFPIKLISALGFLITFFSFTYSIMVLVGYFIGNDPFKGWTPIILLITFLGGIILLSLGMIGQYLWRVLDEIRNRPNYIIDEIINNSEK